MGKHIVMLKAENLSLASPTKQRILPSETQTKVMLFFEDDEFGRICLSLCFYIKLKKLMVAVTSNKMD